MNRRGYAFATADAGTAEELRRQAEEAQALGAGPLRVHDGGSGNANYIPHTAEGWQNMPTGTDLLLNPALIAKHFPGISPTTTAVAHVRRCGWIRAQQLGAFFLEQARAHGAKLVRGKVVAITQSNGTVTGVDIETASSQRHVATPTVVLSPGPYLAPVLALLGLHYDITCECHVKIALKDSAAALPASSPLLFWSDPVELPWTDDEREVLGADAQTAYLLRPFPAGVHARPEGSPGQHYALALWTYDIEPGEPAFPIEWDPHLPEIIVRGLTAMLPGMHAYLDPLPRIPVDGGYYAKTPENRPLVGPLPVAGAYVNAAYSGFGIMTACAGGELLAAHVMGTGLPSYAQALTPSRYDEPGYLERFALGAAAGQM